MTIQRAQPELLALASAVRGEDWADDLALAMAAAHSAGWPWERAADYACRLMFRADAHPRDLTQAVRDPKARTEPSEPTGEWAAARAALAERGQR